MTDNLPLDCIRNVAMIAHIDAGKTTATEGILFYSGFTHRYGSIDEGTTVMDYLDEERTRGITIKSAAASFLWQNTMVHLIDTPGHIDFTAEVERCLRVSDGAVVIFSAVEGVEPQSEKVWLQADQHGVPRVAFINKLDRVGAGFERVVGEMARKFGDLPLVLQVPVGGEADFFGVVDLLHNQLCVWEGENNEICVRKEVPCEMAEVVAGYREQLFERLSDASDKVAEAYLENGEVDAELMVEVLRAETLAGHIVPVFAGSAKKRIGIQTLMDAMVTYLPSPVDELSVSDHHEAQWDGLHDSEPFSGLIFKVVASKTADLLYLRTYSGTLGVGDHVLNSRTSEQHVVKQMVRLFAKNVENIREVGPGDIVGIIGLKDCGTGDSLCDPENVVRFEGIRFPEPLMSMAFESRDTSAKDKLEYALQLVCREDPTLMHKWDDELEQWLLLGMGELHLEVTLHRLEAEFGLDLRAGQPRVAYRETLVEDEQVSVEFHKTLGETEIQTKATVLFQRLPIRSGEAICVVERGEDLNVSKEMLDIAEGALRDALNTGGQYGYPMICVKGTLVELVTYGKKTTNAAITGAMMQALHTCMINQGTLLLEPVMALGIVCPEASVGDLNADLQARGALIKEIRKVAEGNRFVCEVPLSQMFGFGKALPRLTSGRGFFSMDPLGYQEKHDA